MSLLEFIANKLTKYDLDRYGDHGPFEDYEDLAREAITAYEEFTARPRQKSHYVEGLQFL